MRIVYFAVSLLLTVGLIVVLGTTQWLPLPMGRFLSPQHGFWQNAEPFNQKFNDELHFADLKGNASVYFDERLVPHIETEYDEDAYFIQGYLHAKFRLWQMDFQTRAAAGRISEVVGDVALNFDKGKRRLGLAYAAENMLKEIEANDTTRMEIEKYTAGVNAYINSIAETEWPLEYKLLGYAPEKWSNFKTCLFVKQMSQTLAGGSDDLPYSKARDFFGDAAMQILFPQVYDSLSPIIPKGTIFSPASVVPIPPASKDSLYTPVLQGTLTEIAKPDKDNGSNNWAVNGSKTQSGAPILCNDPHLGLSLPSVWFEIQMTTPTMNAYGVSFPGAPGVIIGFNENIAFGFTSASRDVMDYYQVQFKDDSKKQYFFDSSWLDTQVRIEHINVKGKPTVYDTVAYTLWGPVTYDKSFAASTGSTEPLAIRWKAHDASNELMMWHHMDRAANYNDYLNALRYFTCPAHNILFASKNGDIAIQQQGVFPARWNRQGVYVMPGTDSSYMWQGYIPFEENPHIYNPASGYISSANQRAADSAYPYFIPGSYDLYRGIAINRRLQQMQGITAKDMMKLQVDNYNVFAEMARPVLLKHINENTLNEQEKKHLDIVKQWNLNNDINEKGPTIFNIWFEQLEDGIWKDEFAQAGFKNQYPAEATLIEALLRNDSSFVYIDNVVTPQAETLADIITAAFEASSLKADSLEKINQLAWGAYKNTSIKHLLGDKMLPFAEMSLPIGGGEHIINAAKKDHGPSWRMIVELGEQPDAHVVYPGGQSGNPGSVYYNQFVNHWARGEYYKAWFMKRGEKPTEKLVWKMNFKKA